MYIVLTKTLKILRRPKAQKIFLPQNKSLRPIKLQKVTVAITPYFSLLIVDLSSYFIFMHYAY